MIANIKKEEKWIPFLSPKTWKVKKSINRGFTGAEAAAQATQVDSGHVVGVRVPVRP